MSGSKFLICFMVAVAVLVGLAAGAAHRVNDDESHSWKMVYSHDAEGNAVEGSKEELLRLVRMGKPVRVIFGSGRVEHFADSYFLTIFEGEVFAQLNAIQSQQPTTDPTCVTYREPGVYWRTILGTNGQARPLMDGSEARERKFAAKWVVQP